MFVSEIPLIKILDVVDSKIKLSKHANTSSNDNTGKTVIKFWEKIRDLILDTYKKNKEVSDG